MKKQKTESPPASEASEDTVLGGSEGEAPEAAGDPLAVDNFRLTPGIKTALATKGIKSLFDIQAQTLSYVLDGKDLLGRARYSHLLASLLAQSCMLQISNIM